MAFRKKRRRGRKLNRTQVTSASRRQKSSFAIKRRHIRKKRFRGNVHIARRLFVKKILYSILAIAASSGLIYFLFFSQIFLIQQWEVVEKEVTFYNHQLDHYLRPYENKNLIFVNTEEIKTKIESEHPNLSTIQIKKIYPDTLSMKIEQYPLFANVINIVGEEKIEQKLIVNSIGVAVQKDTVDLELPFIKLYTETSYDLLDEVIPNDTLTKISTLVEQFEESFGMKITEAEYKLIEREIHLRTEKDFYVWIDSEKDSEAQLQKLKKALPKLDIYKTPLHYIDLRIGGVENDKVIYRRK